MKNIAISFKLSYTEETKWMVLSAFGYIDLTKKCTVNFSHSFHWTKTFNCYESTDVHWSVLILECLPIIWTIRCFVMPAIQVHKLANDFPRFPFKSCLPKTGPAVLALPGNLWEMQKLRSHSRLAESEFAFYQDPKVMWIHTKIWEVSTHIHLHSVIS